jgi:transposase InsO family protein
MRGKNYLQTDRDAKFSDAFRGILEQPGVKAVPPPPRSPNLNPKTERFMRSVKEECLERMIFFREKSPQAAVANFLNHYRAERNHQGIGNRLIEPGKEVGRTTGEVVCQERLGGMLRYYYRKAA